MRVFFERGRRGKEWNRLTTVRVSTLIMKGSEVRYLLSERLYSFHSWEKS